MVSPRMVGDLWYSKRRHYFCGSDGTSVGRLLIHHLLIHHLRIQHS
jgi:hypothetical protein